MTWLGLSLERLPVSCTFSQPNLRVQQATRFTPFQSSAVQQTPGLLSKARNTHKSRKDVLQFSLKMPKLTEEQEAQLRALENLPADQTDTTDVPERPINRSKAVPRAFYQPVKQERSSWTTTL